MVDVFRSIARAQLEYPGIILAAALVTTVIAAAGIPQIQLQTDFQEGLPDSLAPIEAQDRLETKFGSPDAIIVLFEINDEPVQDQFVTDIRDPRIIGSMEFLTAELRNEPIVDSVNSMAMFFDQNPESIEAVKTVLSKPGTPSFTNRDYTASTMLVTMSEESNERNIRRATAVLEENIEETPVYPGVDVRITGIPVIRTSISDILVTDSATTIAVASGLILLLLIWARGIINGAITFVPLFMGLVWTLGVMGWAGIPLTVATIALGSMILGLGVEYGSFITERILEEMEHDEIDAALYTAIPNTGKAIVGSSATDGVGFLALLLASISFIRDLGITLALGEFLTVAAALIITPAMMVAHQRWFQ